MLACTGFTVYVWWRFLLVSRKNRRSEKEKGAVREHQHSHSISGIEHRGIMAIAGANDGMIL